MKKRKFNIVESFGNWQVKIIFALVAFFIISMIFWFINSLVNEIKTREKNTLMLYAQMYEKFLSIQMQSNDGNDADIYLFFIEEVTPTINFPIIFTLENGEPYEPFELWTLNLNLDKKLPIKKQREIVKSEIRTMGTEYPPLEVKDNDGKVIGKIYYSNSKFVDKLRYFPIISVVGITIFVLIGYIAFSQSRKTEQSKVWVGMAKEAAHQLGTPLSSLMAWMEILKFAKESPDTIIETLDEMEKDISRLSVITTRFSKIGSLPEKENTNISELIESVCVYFDKRLPHLGKKVEINRSLYEAVYAKVNVDLFAWVIENLLKNAAEAIEDKNGQIFIFMRFIPGKKIYIYVKDSGKGIPQKIKSQIFNPGFSTKKRGWGLGLSLCRRIIQDYHGGRIYVKETGTGKGTTFAIELPMVTEENNLIS